MMHIQKIRKTKDKQEGLTLMEMVVTIVIMSVVIATIAPSLLGYVNQAKLSSENASAKTIATAASVVLAQSNVNFTRSAHVEKIQETEESKKTWNVSIEEGDDDTTPVLNEEDIVKVAEEIENLVDIPVGVRIAIEAGGKLAQVKVGEDGEWPTKEE